MCSIAVYLHDLTWLDFQGLCGHFALTDEGKQKVLHQQLKWNWWTPQAEAWQQASSCWFHTDVPKGKHFNASISGSKKYILFQHKYC